MQPEHVQVAAHYTLCLLHWAPSREPIDDKELRILFDIIYHDGFSIMQRSKAASSYVLEKETIFEGVNSAFKHFFGLDPSLDDVKHFLRT